MKCSKIATKKVVDVMKYMIVLPFSIVSIVFWIMTCRVGKSEDSDLFEDAYSGSGRIYNADFSGGAVYYVEFLDHLGHYHRERATSLKKNGRHFMVGQEVPIKYYYLKNGSTVVKITHPDAERNEMNLMILFLTFALVFTGITCVILIRLEGTI